MEVSIYVYNLGTQKCICKCISTEGKRPNLTNFANVQFCGNSAKLSFDSKLVLVSEG